MKKSLLDIVKQVMAETSFSVPTSVSSSNDTLVQQVAALVQSACEELSYEFNWQSMIRQGQITFDGSASYELPADFDRMIPDSYVITGMGGFSYAVDGAMNPGEFLQISTPPTSGTTGFTLSFQVIGDRFYPYPIQPSGTLKFVYVSNKFIRSAAGEWQSTFIQDSDIPLFNARLVVNLVKAKLLASKGLNNGYVVDEYLRLLEQIKGSDVPAKSICLSGGQTYNPDQFVMVS